MKRSLPLFLGLAILHATAAQDKSSFVYFGTYTTNKSRGIYVARFDGKTGLLTTPQLAADTKGPTFLALHPNNRFLYAVGEMTNAGRAPIGAVAAFAVDSATGKLTLLNQQPSGGPGPNYVAVDSTGRCLLVANYRGGSVAALPIGPDGRLSPAASFIQHQGSSVNKQRQAGPHAHFITPSPDNRFALVCDLGLDQVFVYRLEPGLARLTANNPPSLSVEPGAGPRHLAFSPDGRLVYVLNEMACTLDRLEYDAKAGSLKEIQSLSTLPADFKGSNTCAEVQVHPSGKFVYASNRGHDSIAVFAAASPGGPLSLVQLQSTQGKTPRHFALAPDGNWMIAENQDSDSLLILKVDSQTGRLSPAGPPRHAPSPVCCVFLPASP